METNRVMWMLPRRSCALRSCTTSSRGAAADRFCYDAHVHVSNLAAAVQYCSCSRCISGPVNAHDDIGATSSGGEGEGGTRIDGAEKCKEEGGRGGKKKKRGLKSITDGSRWRSPSRKARAETQLVTIAASPRTRAMAAAAASGGRRLKTKTIGKHTILLYVSVPSSVRKRCTRGTLIIYTMLFSLTRFRIPSTRVSAQIWFKYIIVSLHRRGNIFFSSQVKPWVQVVQEPKRVLVNVSLFVYETKSIFSRSRLTLKR